MIYFYCAKKLLFILTSPHLLTKKREQEIRGKYKGDNMKMEKKKVCGTCKHSKSEVPFGEFYCDNEESDCYGCECMYDDSCIDYEVEE